MSGASLDTLLDGEPDHVVAYLDGAATTARSSERRPIASRAISVTPASPAG